LPDATVTVNSRLMRASVRFLFSLRKAGMGLFLLGFTFLFD
jgi:hypothetical protein